MDIKKLQAHLESMVTGVVSKAPAERFQVTTAGNAVKLHDSQRKAFYTTVLEDTKATMRIIPVYGITETLTYSYSDYDSPETALIAISNQYARIIK